MMDLLREAQAFQQDLISWRRYLHQNPEIGDDLPNTCRFVREKLEQMGLAPQDVGKCGLTVLLGNAAAKPCLLIRCDMDALPIQEETDLPFASHNGAMHACGHDLHTVMLLGAAKLLKAHEAELKGCVKLIWQPAEETMTGADMMIKAGILEAPHVDAAITIHCDCMSNFPLGSVTILGEGVTMASNDIYRIDVEGVGTHGAFPNQGVDPIIAAAAICTSLQEILAREIRAADQVVITQGSFHAGNVPNVIPSSAYMEGTVRTFDKNVRAYVLERMEAIVKSIGEAYRCNASITWKGGCQPLYNDPAACSCIQRYVSQFLGPDRFVVEHDTAYASEDFANFLDYVPGLQMFLVVGSIQDGSRYPMHNPHAVFDDAQLPTGAAVLAYVAIQWLLEH